MSLRWEPVPGATGYRIHYGETSRGYTHVVDVGTVTEGTLSALEDCQTYYVAVKAYNASGESEDYSNEIQGWARPRLDGGQSAVMKQGDQIVLNLTGGNFDPNAELVFHATDLEGSPLVHVDSVSISCNQIQALISVEPAGPGLRAMEVGDHTFDILNPDGVQGSVDYAVTFDTKRLDLNRSDENTKNRVDGKDLIWLAYAHGTGEGDDRFNPDADLNGDGLVDGEDLAYLATAFGQCWDGSVWGACP